MKQATIGLVGREKVGWWPNIKNSAGVMVYGVSVCPPDAISGRGQVG